MSDKKVTKATAHYRYPAPDPHKRCQDCTMWRQGTCTAVKGDIAPGATCDYFKYRRK